ncbi:MAG: T9SS type A sorting domain-containing protein [Candidatus Eisenbacteria bacterium]|uniref:T9SS type A sorting domain-containing protein n=1 Tax=Eiseniibacteriota bacterium TaxID=2212470 RepID=A0A956NFQ5_UNCEI|nr:T9SS type A sorting domain-containing protein [Candidatus Eisenbacteria bacterium]
MLRLTLIVLALAVAGSAMAASYVVEPDGSGDFPTIQAALDAAVNGDVVLLGDGVFTGDGNRDLSYGGKEIAVISVSGDPALCTIDCQGSSAEPHRAIGFNGEGSGARFEAVTVIGGYAPGSGYTANGGAIGITAGSPTIIGCVFQQCQANWAGGAIAFSNATPGIFGCDFIDNLANWGGAAILGSVSDAVIEDCRFVGNTASSWGGALCTYYPAGGEVRRCTFDGNRSYNTGGAVKVSGTGWTGFYECVFIGNTADNTGGAFQASEAVVDMERCSFHHNASPDGAGLRFVAGGGIHLSHTIVCACDGTSVSAMADAGVIEFTCSDVFGNTGGDWVGPIEGQLGVEGNFSLDPLFCDPEAGDLRIDADSPCLPHHHPDGPWTCGSGIIGALPVGCSPADSPLSEEVAAPFALQGATPNPFGDTTVLTFRLSQEGSVSLEIFDAGGRSIRHLLREPLAAGAHTSTWDGRDDGGRHVESGIYFAKMSVDDRHLEQRIVVLR